MLPVCYSGDHKVWSVTYKPPWNITKWGSNQKTPLPCMIMESWWWGSVMVQAVSTTWFLKFWSTNNRLSSFFFVFHCRDREWRRMYQKDYLTFEDLQNRSIDFNSIEKRNKDIWNPWSNPSTVPKFRFTEKSSSTERIRLVRNEHGPKLLNGSFIFWGVLPLWKSGCR